MIGNIIAAALPLLRVSAESLQTDRCRIERESSQWDEAERKTVTTWDLVHGDVPCHFTEPVASDRTLVTDEAATLRSPMLATALTVMQAMPDDRVTITSATDPTLVDAVLWVTHVVGDTHPVERLVQCRWVQ